MASTYGKFLAPVTVPTGGWDFVWAAFGGPYTATIPAGDYATMLHVADALETAMKAEVALSNVAIGSTGITSISSNTMSSVTFASCDDDLLLWFGFDETETVVGAGGVSATITTTLPHRDGWYPGVISYGAPSYPVTRGEGIDSDLGWYTTDKAGEQVAGSGSMRQIVPARRIYRREINFPLISRSEALDRFKGPAAWRDRWVGSDVWWYPDRTDGLVGSYGTQIDPGPPDYEGDTDNDYYKVKIVGAPKFTQNSKSTEYMSVRLTLHGEPD